MSKTTTLQTLLVRYLSHPKSKFRKVIEDMENTNLKIPRMMTISQVAQTGLLPENALRVMVRCGEIPAVYSGSKAFINFDNLCARLAKLGAEEPASDLTLR